MKLVLSIVFVFCITYALGEYTSGDNGKPECNKPEELLRPWRNNFDPTRYWMCRNVNSPAENVQCPIGTGFIDTYELFGCINWVSWQWSQPENPPSKNFVANIFKNIHQ